MATTPLAGQSGTENIIRLFNVSNLCFKASHYMIDSATRPKGIRRRLTEISISYSCGSAKR